MNFTMRKVFYLFSIFGAINNSKALIRSGTALSGKVMSSVEHQGVIVKKLNKTSTEIFYTEEFNVDKNPLKLYWDYFFENTGKRQIIKVDNLCAQQKYGTPEYAAQLYVLKFFANTTKCPIKKGTKAVFTLGISYIYSISNPGCGFNDGSFSVFKKNSRKDKTPLVFLFNFRGYITGADC